MTGSSRTARLMLLALLVVGTPAVWAQAGASKAPRIYSCVDATGKRISSDRSVPECAAREQRVLNSDGSVKQVVPPAMTAEERAEADAREREAVAEKAARQDEARRDRNLIARYPNEAAHRKARETALDDVGKAVRLSEARVSALASERKRLLDESEFYAGKPLPAKLKTALEANEASGAAQRTLIQNQQAEIGRIDAIYDVELARLKKLWAGAAPGSIGPASAAVAAAATPKPTTR